MERRISVNPTYARKRSAGFTLVELLVVLAIIAILSAVSLPAISSLMDSKSLTQAGQQVADQVSLARQLASTHNSTMELRLFKLPNATTTGYTELQIWTSITNSSGVSAMQPASKVCLLPQKVVISENTTLSGALLGNTPATMATGTGPLSGATYVAFEISASGIVTPPLGMSANSLIVLSARYAANTTLPTNYVMIQINPVTATPLIYRP